MALQIIRTIFLLAVLAIAATYATTPEVLQQSPEPSLSPPTKVTLVILLPVVVAVLIMVLDVFIEHKSLSNISGLFFGVVAGVVLAYVLGLVIDLVAAVFLPLQFQPETQPPVQMAPTPAMVRRVPVSPATQPSSGPAITPEDHSVDRLVAAMEHLAVKDAERTQARTSSLVAMIKLLVGACTIYLCVSFVMQTKDDFRFIIPYVEFARQSRGTRPLLLDTSVIIDGRIADIADTRILTAPMVVPKFVLEELQNVADSADKLKRNRGRRGLDILNRLQGNVKIQIRIAEARVPAVEQATEVDQKLVALAQHMDGGIVTNDYNLNKVAQLRGVEVININDLANALKPVFLPGELLTVKIIKPGEESGQGIGYLDDGTMIVAEQARDHVGQDVSIMVTSVLQTSAGRMIFGKMEGPAGPRPAGPARPIRRGPSQA